MRVQSMYFAYWVGIISSSNRISSCFLSLLLKAKKRIMVVINKSKSTVEFVLQHIHCKMLHLCTVFILTLLILSSAKLWCLPIQSKKHHENSLKMPKNANEHHSRTYFVLVLRQTKVVKVRFNLQKLFCWRHSCSESTNLMRWSSIHYFEIRTSTSRNPLRRTKMPGQPWLL